MKITMQPVTIKMIPKRSDFRDPFFGPFLTIFLQKGKSYEKKGVKMTPPIKMSFPIKTYAFSQTIKNNDKHVL